ncbi:MAG: type II secretion system protein GspD, partial [Chthoniobacterales bacterium]
SVDSMQPLDIGPNSVKAGSPKSDKALTQAPPNTAGANGAQVIWNADSNTLYVVATRQQHEWVEGYLSSVDRPQNLIAIEVKFFESKKDPRKQLGVDWAGTLQNGFTLAARNITAAPNGTLTLDQQAEHLTQSGTLPANDASGPYNYNTGNKTTTATFGAPYSAVLSASDVAMTIRAFLEDRDTTTVSYPRVLTLNNREVVIRSVINQPVLASSSSVTPGVGGTTTASVSYLPIGTIINVLPRVLDDSSVVLDVSVTVSSIIGEEPIAGNSYPIASSRVYTAELHVTSGFTLAIGGLEEATDERLRNGIPFLKDIPLLGEAFKSNDHRRSRKNLMIFITPTMLGPRTPTGIAEKPESVIPIAPDEPTPPAFTTDGMLVGGSAALPNAVDWIVRRLEYYRQIVRENRTDRKTLDEIAGIISVCGLLQEQIGLLKEARPGSAGHYDEQLARVDITLAGLQELEIKAKKDILRF